MRRRGALIASVAMALALSACGAPAPTPSSRGIDPSSAAALVSAAPDASASGSLTASPSPDPSTAATSSPPPSASAPPDGSASPSPAPSSIVSATPSPTPASSSRPSPSPAAAIWHPSKGATWQWQLSGTANLSYAASVYDLDVDDTPASTVARLHALGSHVICYVDVGTWESYRADASRFPKTVLGKVVDGWPDERWLDIRKLSVLEPILARRLDTCARKGFDAVEPDWLNAYEEDTGFPITRAQSIAFDLWVARAAHARGLGVAQKNAPGLTSALHGHFDFAITEDCAYYAECSSYRAYLAAGRAVLDAEYIWGPATFCPKTKPMGVSAIGKRLELDAWRKACP